MKIKTLIQNGQIISHHNKRSVNLKNALNIADSRPTDSREKTSWICLHYLQHLLMSYLQKPLIHKSPTFVPLEGKSNSRFFAGLFIKLLTLGRCSLPKRRICTNQHPLSTPSRIPSSLIYKQQAFVNVCGEFLQNPTKFISLCDKLNVIF